MKSRVHLFAALLLLGCACAMAADSKPARPISAVEHVVLLSIDGLRPDLALRANMPTLRGLLREGSYSFWAKTTEVSVTLPSHTSMVTGVTPKRHGVTWNGDLPPGQSRYPRYPTIMELASQAGYVTAMVAGKSKFAALEKPGTLSYSYVPPRDPGVVGADVVVARAEQIIGAHRPDLLFIHLPDVDSAGHQHGWGSAEQIAALEQMDRRLERLLSSLERAGIRRSTVIILSADHGGAGDTHGPDDARSRHIPWIIVGPGVRHDFDLTRIAELNVRTEDSAATIAYLLGLPWSRDLDGHAVLQAFQSRALPTDGRD